jgi:predicted  nucleic acid-binding Zn-ribbon protein
MASEAGDTIKAAEGQKVPDNLLQRLHEANERFHAAKQQLEHATGDSEYSHQQRIDQAEEQLRLAEREVEQVTLEIHGSLKPTSAVEEDQRN